MGTVATLTLEATAVQHPVEATAVPHPVEATAVPQHLVEATAVPQLVEATAVLRRLVEATAVPRHLVEATAVPQHLVKDRASTVPAEPDLLAAAQVCMVATAATWAVPSPAPVVWLATLVASHRLEGLLAVVEAEEARIQQRLLSS